MSRIQTADTGGRVSIQEQPAGRALAGGPAAAPTVGGRLVSLDAFRGLVMILMVSAGLRIPRVVENFAQSPELRHLKTPTWELLARHTDHAKWAGCNLWDLIQPSFMFVVGAAVAFSVARRREQGQSFAWMLTHAIVRAVVLVFLSIFLISNWSQGTMWLFTNVLAQIGLGYVFVFLLAWVRPRWQMLAAGGVLLASWGAFALYPAPAKDFDLAKVELKGDWQRLEGFSSHWEKNTNLAARVDQWFLNLFPREKRFTYEAGGYQTLNFVPSLATMIFGLLAGGLIRGGLKAWQKLGIMVGVGVVGLGLGWGLGWLGVCPVVKRIWTPSWAIYSAGWAFLALALFYAIIEMGRLKGWAYPLVVVGANSIAIYCMSMLLRGWVGESMRRHFGKDVFELWGTFEGSVRPYAPMLEAGFFVLFCWVVCWWMYRKKVYIKI